MLFETMSSSFAMHDVLRSLIYSLEHGAGRGQAIGIGLGRKSSSFAVLQQESSMPVEPGPGRGCGDQHSTWKRRSSVEVVRGRHSSNIGGRNIRVHITGFAAEEGHVGDGREGEGTGEVGTSPSRASSQEERSAIAGDSPPEPAKKGAPAEPPVVSTPMSAPAASEQVLPPAPPAGEGLRP
ncbi:unnamed protein product, partial [Amoebophrya sp. A25]|eukprot:GSA25T00026992001.1